MGEPTTRREYTAPCPYCEGARCEECDFTGGRVTTIITGADGATMRVHGSAPLTREAQNALAAIAAAALKRVEADRA